MKIAILYGGDSPEREISLKSGKCVYDALKKKYKKVKLFDPSKKDFIKNFLNFKPDLVFIALHGGIGENGGIQGFLETLKIPYTGSGILASSICMNKIVCKEILIFNKIPTPPFVIIQNKKIPKIPFSFPVVVKPANLGSTIGIEIVFSKKELNRAIKNAFRFDEEVFIEKYIKGTEVTVGILGNENIEVLPIIEIRTKKGFYSYKAKYTPGESFHIIPPNLPKWVIEKVEEIAVKTYKVLKCNVFARMEIIVEEKTYKPYVLEVNTIPGLTRISLIPDAAKFKGISFEELCEKIIELSLEKWKKIIK